MSVGLSWPDRMSDDDKFRNFRAYQFESEQSERKASRRKWALVLILACSSVTLAWLLSRRYLAVVMFSLSAPLSYLAGRHLGMLEFSNAVLPLISLGWACLALLSCAWVKPQLYRDNFDAL